MKITLLIFLLSMVYASSPAQYFFTGEVKDPHGDKLQNVSITVASSHLTYRTNINGDFGIISRKEEDTLIFSFEGYQSYTATARATEQLQVTLRMLAFARASENSPLISVIRTVKVHRGAPYPTHAASPDTAAPPRAPDTTLISYSSLTENPFVGQAATVSFPVNISHASYPNIRRILGMGFTVPPEAVKIEEMLNYHNFNYEEPEGTDLFHCSSDLVSCPWNATHKLLYLNICTRRSDMSKSPPGNFVFLIDASGSMDMPNKLPLVKSGFRLLVENLRNIDTVSIVAFGGRTGIALEGVSGSEKGKIIRAIESLLPDGPSPGGEGLQLAYLVARRQFIAGGNNRVVLITDGDISEGASDEKALEDLVEQRNKDGIQLTCMGVGMRNYKDSRLPAMAEKGHGNFAYLDNEQQAEKQLADELSQNLCTVAENVYATTGFNPILVKEYRLIGFSNKAAVG
ncbi:MAG TPA: von Willebrand factor type A domain-containing protein, partial [Puia sp.]|nr:von Willebrand factor type A domain-containing protein [Puia sp.]